MSDRPELSDRARARYLPMVGADNWAAWVSQLTDGEIESMNSDLPWASGGRLDLGIDRDDGSALWARNDFKVFFETFEGLAFPMARGHIRVIRPPTAEELLGAVRQALIALIEPSPMDFDSDYGNSCHWCDAPEGEYPGWNKQRKPVQHEHDCPWTNAHRALGRRLPDGHEGKDST